MSPVAPPSPVPAEKGSVLFQNVTKRFGQFAAIPDLTLQIRPGQLVTLLGPSGCGKTTTLRMLAGLEHPTSGRILIGGRDVTALPANERDVSMVFQSYALFPHMTVLQNVAYGLESAGLSRAIVQERALAGLAQVGLHGFGARLPSELSGGQQQRVAVARALVLEPEVLLLDEPLSNLDARMRRSVRTEIRELQQKLGFTAVYVTHDQVEALAVSDMVVVMRAGQIEQMAPPRDLYQRPANGFIARFIGEANVLPCEVLAADGRTALVTLGGLEHRLASDHPGPGKAEVAIRPNAIVIRDLAPGLMPGRIRSACYLGDHIEYEIETEQGVLFAVDAAVERQLSHGCDVGIDLAPRGVALIPSAS